MPRLLALLLAIGLLAGAEPARLALLCVGDSLTAQRHLPEALAEGLRGAGRWSAVELTVLAAGGETPDGMRRRIADGSWALPDAPGQRQAIVLAGTNRYDAAEVVALADDLAARGWPVAVLATPPRRTPPGREDAAYGFPQANRDFNARLAALLAAQTRHRWIDARDALRDPAHAPADGDWLAPAYAADHTHLTAAGYRTLAAAVAAALLAP